MCRWTELLWGLFSRRKNRKIVFWCCCTIFYGIWVWIYVCYFFCELHKPSSDLRPLTLKKSIGGHPYSTRRQRSPWGEVSDTLPAPSFLRVCKFPNTPCRQKNKTKRTSHANGLENLLFHLQGQGGSVTKVRQVAGEKPVRLSAWKPVRHLLFLGEHPRKWKVSKLNKLRGISPGKWDHAFTSYLPPTYIHIFVHTLYPEYNRCLYFLSPLLSTELSTI